MKILDSKIYEADNEGRKVEKQFQKEGSSNVKNFIEDYIAQRKNYHKFQMYKKKMTAN